MSSTSSSSSNSSSSSEDERKSRKRKRAKREDDKLWRQLKKIKKKLKKKRARERESSAEREESVKKHRKKSRHHSSRQKAESDRDDVEQTHRSSSHRSQSNSSRYSESDQDGSHIEIGQDDLEKYGNQPETSSGKETNRSDKESSELPPREAPNSSQTVKDQNKNTEKLKDSIIALLGEDPNVNKSVGPPVHQALAGRWLDILQNGLPKDKKEEILKKYTPAENCIMLQAPKLGPHVQSTMSSISLKKDAYQMLAQNQLGRGISALGLALSELLNSQSDKPEDQKQITLLSDTGRILTDLFHTMSTSRRYFITSGFNPAEKAMAIENKIDEFLFGKDFSEKVKAFESVERSTKKRSLQPTVGTSRQRLATNSGNYLNSKGPSRRNQTATFKSQRGGEKSKGHFRAYNHQMKR